ncbi:uncharacterized protein LOC131029738 [Cryptomeria japonica]|uniref:uncharacterized protein LOC131029738 n=1 Tax=Cryptomeria japonica TaxID=3369 RepID=UPI0027DAA2F4|nr:uncharacterized protein LOC131029738 [Cryptomeria japonica]XP_057816360.2 uncharacterized protein LOC131029738 [Cryptomeria japonica]
MRLVRLMQGGLHIRLSEQATILVQRYGAWFIQFPRFSYIWIAGFDGAPLQLPRYPTDKIVLMEVARQSRSAGSLLRDSKQDGFTFPMIIGNQDVHLKTPSQAEESFAELASYGLQEHFPRKCFDHDNLAKRAYGRQYKAKESVEDYWKNCSDDYEVRRREYSRLSVQQMPLYEYRRVRDQLVDSGNCLQVWEFEAVRHLLLGVDWSQDPIIDFEAIMAARGRYTGLHQQIERLIHEGVQFTYHLMGNLDSQSFGDEGTSNAPKEEIEKPEKRKKAKASRGTWTSKRTRREKIPIRRPEVTSSSKDPSSSDDVVELDYIPAPPSQSDIDAFGADDPPAPDMLDVELRVIGSAEPHNQIEEGEIPSNQGIEVHESTQQSRHELLLHNTTKGDSTVEGEQKTDNTCGPEKTKAQPSHKGTGQLFSEVGENSATSKELGTSSTPPIAEQLQICDEMAENVKE